MSFSKENVYTRWSIIDSEDFQQAVITSLQTLQGTFFSPNILFLRLPGHKRYDEELNAIINEAQLHNMDIQLYVEDPIAQLGRSSSINVWIREKSPNGI
ncbi:MAG: hypothetical protein U5K69_27070 [Balneolaceae bacterium]|nr:hypothetical protein [Balneolaceae bacterium]